jgi:hypothetical protein
VDSDAAGRGFRFEVGHHSDLIPATCRGISGVIGWVSDSDIHPPRDQPQGGLDASKARADDEADTIHILKGILDAEDAKRAVQTWGSVKSLQDQRCDGEGRISKKCFLQDFEGLT